MDAISLVILIADVTIIMLGFNRNLNGLLMIKVAVVLFVPTESAQYCRSYTISVMREINSERIFMKSCLVFIFLVFEVMVKLPYSLLLIH